jgi:hypothetical protein
LKALVVVLAPEIRVDPILQAFCLPDVQNLVVGIDVLVNARFFGQAAQENAQMGKGIQTVGHSTKLLRTKTARAENRTGR